MMLFSSGGHNYYNGFDEENVDYYYYSSSSSSSVDCTLSLGTPSTHSSSDDEKKRSPIISGFGWNILQSKQTTTSPAPAVDSHRGGGDPLLARRCANCDTTSTPLWRNGPKGPKSLCNACGIRFKKEERRATAAGNGGSSSSGGGDGSNWAVQPPQRIPCFSSSGYGSNEYRFMEGREDHHQYHQYYNHHHDSVDHSNYPFLSWRFNGEAKSRA